MTKNWEVFQPTNKMVQRDAVSHKRHGVEFLKVLPSPSTSSVHHGEAETRRQSLKHK